MKLAPVFQCDPYVKITLGKKTVNDHENYVPCTLDPVFGKCVLISLTISLHSQHQIECISQDSAWLIC